MLLILVATVVAVLAAAVCGRLASPPTARREEARFSWSSTSMAALFAGVFAGTAGYLSSALEAYGIFVLALAVMGPLTAAAWDQRRRESRVYRPSTTGTLRNEETWDDPALAPPLFAGWRDEQVTARENS